MNPETEPIAQENENVEGLRKYDPKELGLKLIMGLALYFVYLALCRAMQYPKAPSLDELLIVLGVTGGIDYFGFKRLQSSLPEKNDS